MSEPRGIVPDPGADVIAEHRHPGPARHERRCTGKGKRDLSRREVAEHGLSQTLRG